MSVNYKKPLDLVPGEVIDLIPLMDAADVEFDYGDRAAAEDHYATVEAVERAEPWKKDPSQRLVVVHNDICSMAIPENFDVPLQQP
jgi:hypothetical protein